MYNRKFNIKRDFGAINKLENKIFPLLKKEVKNEDSFKELSQYIWDIFFNQYKN